MKKAIFTYLILLLTNITFGQSYFKIDSLKKELQNCDSSKQVVLYNEIVWQLRNSNPSEAIVYGKKAVEIAKNIKFYNGLAKAYGFLGRNHEPRQD